MGSKITLLLAALMLLLPLAAGAETASLHPDYTHALPDLRTARWLLAQQSGDPAERANENEAIQDIDNSIRTITKNGFDDHKDLNDHAPIQMANDHRGRLNQALELLHQAHAEISKEEADPMAAKVRNKALDYIDLAGRAIGRALEAH
jgi:hypothetical protein